MIKVSVHREGPERTMMGIHIYIDDEESVERFKLLLHRGLNCWEDAPAELKELGDMFTHGRITQNHVKQRINSKPESNPELGTVIEQMRIAAWIQEYGHLAWRTALHTGISHQIASGKWKPPAPTILGIGPAKEDTDQTHVVIVEAKPSA